MNTIIKKVEQEDDESFKLAADILQQGGLVAFPTETVYGLGADALNKEASKKIYAAKGRPSDNPLIVHIADFESLPDIVSDIPDVARILMNKYWPGPMTLVFNKSAKVPYETTGGLDTVAVRMPSHPIAAKLIRQSGVYIAAPSANTSGRPSPTLAKHVIEDMSGKIDMIIDGGQVGIGLESTIIDVTSTMPTILRPGYITQEMLSEVIGRVDIDKAILSKPEPGLHPKAPGMKYRHYAPKAELTMCEGELNKVTDYINEQTKMLVKENKKVGIIATSQTKDCYKYGIVKVIGSRTSQDSIALNLYNVLREFDDEQVDYIFTETFDNSGLGNAIMNRLTKAAGYKIIKL